MKNFMKIENEAEGAMAAFNAARTQLNRLLINLDQVISGLGRQEVPSVKTLNQDIDELCRAAGRIQDAQKSLAKYKDETRGSELDIDAARTEVLSRLARICEQRSSEELSG